MTLEDLLVGSRTIDFRVRAEPMEGYVACYIHPLNEDGKTIDFTVVGNQVTVAVRAPIEGDILEHPKLETFEFETATIEQLPPLDDELKAMLGHEEALLVQTSDEGGAIGNA